jgi:hypothetical protein
MTAVMLHTSSAYRLYCLAMDIQGKMAVPALEPAALQINGCDGDSHAWSTNGNGAVDNGASARTAENDDPFAAPSTANKVNKGSQGNGAALTGADEPSKDEKEQAGTSVLVEYMRGKHLSAEMMPAATVSSATLAERCRADVTRGLELIMQELMLASMDISQAYADRGSALDADSQLRHTLQVATYLRSPIMLARVESRIAELNIRMRQFDKTAENLASVRAGLEGVSGLFSGLITHLKRTSELIDSLTVPTTYMPKCSLAIC